MPASPLAAGATAAIVLALAAALLFGSGLGLPWRIGAVVLLALLVVPAIGELAGYGARRSFGRDETGRWWLRQGEEAPDYVQPAGPALMLGPWIWLRLRGCSGSHPLLLDGRRMEPEAFRRLQVVLRLEAEDLRGAANDHDRPNC
ncbi:MAG: hypothetical protein IT480_08950 [Gammaproteobacteria bacterium]|nr:hypothetical protein [Gammaproteobacteria bacterium]